MAQDPELTGPWCRVGLVSPLPGMPTSSPGDSCLGSLARRVTRRVLPACLLPSSPARLSPSFGWLARPASALAT